MQPPPRTARVVLVGEGERVLGALPAVPVATPWWHDAAPVVDAVRTAFGLEVAVLRLLDTERAGPHGGAVTYVGQLSGGSTVRTPGGRRTPAALTTMRGSPISRPRPRARRPNCSACSSSPIFWATIAASTSNRPSQAMRPAASATDIPS